MIFAFQYNKFYFWIQFDKQILVSFAIAWGNIWIPSFFFSAQRGFRQNWCLWSQEDPNRCSKNHRLFVPLQQSAISGKPCANRLNPLFGNCYPYNAPILSIDLLHRKAFDCFHDMLIRFFQTVSDVNRSIIFVREDLTQLHRDKNALFAFHFVAVRFYTHGFWILAF